MHSIIMIIYPRKVSGAGSQSISLAVIRNRSLGLIGSPYFRLNTLYINQGYFQYRRIPILFKKDSNVL